MSPTLLFGLLAVPFFQVSRPMLSLDAGGHTAIVLRTFFSPDSALLFTLSSDRTVRVWDVSTGECRRVIRVPSAVGIKGMITDGAISSDGSRLVLSTLGSAVDAPGDVYLVDADTGSIIRNFSGNRKLVSTCAISPSGRLLASGGDDYDVHLHPTGGDADWTLSGHTGKIRQLVFSPDGRILASGSYDKTIRLWDVANRRLIRVLTAHTDQIRSLAWSPDGSLLASSAADRRIFLWRPDGEQVWATNPLENTPRVVDFAGPGRLVYGFGEAVDHKFDCVVFDLSRGQETHRFRSHNNSVFALATSPDGRLVASSGGNDHDTFIWEANTGRALHRIAAPSKGKYVAAWSRDGRSVAWGETRNDDMRTFVDLPLHRSFTPSTLELGAAHGQYVRGRHRSSNVALQWQDVSSLGVWSQGQAIGTLRVFLDSPGLRETVAGWSLIDDHSAIVGTSHGLYRYEVPSGRITNRYHAHSSLVYGAVPSPDGRYFATCSIDQMVCIWKFDRDVPLLSIFNAGREWIAWTPEGYYAASPGGERLVGWLVNEGVKTPAFHPAERFYKNFFRPEAIKKLLEVGDIHQAVALTSGDGGNPIDITNALPPKVAITAPSGKTDVGEERLRISATATGTSAAPVTSLKVYVNGRPHLGTGAERKFSPGKEDATASWSIDLPVGRNTIAVMAGNGASHATSEPIVAVRRGKDGAEPTLPRLFVLAAGVSKYQSDAIAQLFYSAEGARGVASTFKTRSQPAPYEDVQLKELLDGDATRVKVLAALSSIEAEMKPTDFAVIYYSGHGDRTKNGFCLLPCDADPKKLDETAITGDELKKGLASLKGQVLLILDACHSGEVIKDLTRDMGREENGLNVLCSSFAAQKSLENNQLRQGPFTYALLECLEGKSGTAADGVVYFHHLMGKIPDRVDELTGGVQQVTAQVAPNRPKFPLAKPGNQ